MEKSVEQPINGPQGFPLNKQQVGAQPPINPYNGGPVQNINPNPGYVQPVIVSNQSQPVQVVNVVSNTFGTKPVSITCQFCKNPVTTQVKKTCNCCSCLLCFVTSFVFWVLVQCFRNKEINCWDAEHRCPSCGQMLGNYTSC